MAKSGGGFRRRCQKAGVSGVTLPCSRSAWAERAKRVGMPEWLAHAALGHNSKAIHRAYAKKAIIVAPSLEDYENKAAALPTALRPDNRTAVEFDSSTALLCSFGGYRRPQTPRQSL